MSLNEAKQQQHSFVSGIQRSDGRSAESESC